MSQVATYKKDLQGEELDTDYSKRQRSTHALAARPYSGPPSGLETTVHSSSIHGKVMNTWDRRPILFKTRRMRTSYLENFWVRGYPLRSSAISALDIAP